MKADQERVKNLLIDTVTLLCKNSLTYEDELCVEGLLGVKVDQKDVFFVHISETFPSALSVQKAQLEAATEASPEEQPQTPKSSNKRPHQSTDSPAYRDSPSSRSSSDNKLNIKTEHLDSDDDACIITDDHSPQLPSASSVSNQAERIAGQRRTPRSPRSPRHQLHHQQQQQQQQQQAGDQGAFQSTDSMGYQDYPEFSHIGKEESNGEPPRKRLAMGEGGGGEDDSFGGESQWPNIAAGMDMAGHAAQAAFQDSGDSQMSAGAGDMSQPGCSSWPQGLQQATDTIHEVIQFPPAARRSHARGEDYRCRTCGKQFMNNYKLTRHLRTHTGERPFTCMICKQSATVKCTIKSHISIVHKITSNQEDFISCSVTEKKFSPA